MKKIKKNQKSIIKYLVVLGLLVLGGMFFYNRMKQSPQVAEIAAGESCTSNLASFEVSSACSSDGFSSYKYSCKNSATLVDLGTSGTCLAFPVAIAKASAICGKTCIGQVTPPPTKTSPNPTFTPTPSVISTSTPTASTRPTTSPKPTSTPVTSCAKQLGNWTFRDLCSKQPTSYRYLDYKCMGDDATSTIGDGKTCKTTGALQVEAKSACLNRTCVSPTPTASPVVKVFPTPNPRRCFKFFGKDYCFQTKR